jgi:hypothetical protein
LISIVSGPLASRATCANFDFWETCVITRTGLVSTVGLSALLWFQSTTNTMQCNTQPQKPIVSTGEIVGVFAAVGAVVVGTVVLVHVHDVHTTIKGCV